jgi:hypothetical protein
LLLGFQEHDIAPLISAKLLVPLGKPAPNAPKYFAAVEIAERASSPEWLSSATRVIAKHWRRKNQLRRSAHNIFMCNRSNLILADGGTLCLLRF